MRPNSKQRYISLFGGFAGFLEQLFFHHASLKPYLDNLHPQKIPPHHQFTQQLIKHSGEREREREGINCDEKIIQNWNTLQSNTTVIQILIAQI